MDIVTDYAMSSACNGRKFPNFMDNLIQKHGVDKVSTLISITINRSEWDLRYDREVKAWAKTVPSIPQPPSMPEGRQRDFYEFVLDTHPVILNQAAIYAMKKEQEKVMPVKANQQNKRTLSKQDKER